MARNPLTIDPEREHRVRERAYLLWEADGKPHGRDVEYWERARELDGMEESIGSGLLPNPQNSPDGIRDAGVEEATIQDNLGEFPDGLRIRERLRRLRCRSGVAVRGLRGVGSFFRH